MKEAGRLFLTQLIKHCLTPYKKNILLYAFVERLYVT